MIIITIEVKNICSLGRITKVSFPHVEMQEMFLPIGTRDIASVFIASVD